eukprot:tig00020572_g11565.t1
MELSPAVAPASSPRSQDGGREPLGAPSQKVTAASPSGNVIGTLELTKWDLARPVVPEQADRVVTVGQRAIDIELTCPICLSIMDNPYSVMECMHRFCAECINRAIRANIKECPTCRVRIVSKRSLRPDPQFAGLIRAFYPNLAEHEAMQQAQLKEILANSPHYRALLKSCEEQQRRLAPAPRRRAEVSPSPPPAEDGDESPAPSRPKARRMENGRGPARLRARRLGRGAGAAPASDRLHEIPLYPHPSETRLPRLPEPSIGYDPSQLLCSLAAPVTAAVAPLCPPGTPLSDLVLWFGEAAATPESSLAPASESSTPLRDLVEAWKGPGTLTLYYSLTLPPTTDPSPVSGSSHNESGS